MSTQTMLDTATLDLIRRVIDGDATTGEVERLDALQRESAEVRDAVASLAAASRPGSPAPAEPRPHVAPPLPAEAAERQPSDASPASFRLPRLFTAAWAVFVALILVVVVVAPLRYFNRIGSKHRANAARATNFDWPAVTTIHSGPVSLIVRRDADLTLLEPIVGHRPAAVSVVWAAADADLVATTGVTDASSEEGRVTFHLRSPSDRGGVIVRRSGQRKSTEFRVEVDSREALRAAVPLP